MGLVIVVSRSSRDPIVMLQKDYAVLSGMLALLIGIPIVILHNIWEGPWEIVVTLIGWVTVIKGFVRLLNNPKINQLRDKRLSQFHNNTAIYGWVSILAGCVMMYGAYFSYL